MKNSPEVQKFKCEFCDREFSRESTISAHTCKKKLRWMEKDSILNKLAFSVFCRFYELNRSTYSRKEITYEQFVNSTLFNDFMFFAKWLLDHKIFNKRAYIDHLIRDSIKIQDWTKESVYQRYVKSSLIKEPISTAVERGILYINEWAEKNSKDMSQFFEMVSPHRIVNDITLGKFSPWMLFVCSTSDKLLNRFDDSHYKFLGNILEAKVWNINLHRNKKEVDEIKALMKEYSI